MEIEGGKYSLFVSLATWVFFVMSSAKATYEILSKIYFGNKVNFFVNIFFIRKFHGKSYTKTNLRQLQDNPENFPCILLN